MTGSDLPDLDMDEIDGVPLGALWVIEKVLSDGTKKSGVVELGKYFIEFDKPSVLPWTIDQCDTSRGGAQLPSLERVKENPRNRIGMVLRDYSPKYGAGFENWKFGLKNVPVKRQTGGPLNKRQAKTGLTWVGDEGRDVSIYRFLDSYTPNDNEEVKEIKGYIAYLLPNTLSEDMCKKGYQSDRLEPHTDREFFKNTIPLNEDGEPTYGKEIDTLYGNISPLEVGYEPICDRVYPEAYWEVFGDEDPRSADEFFETFAPARDFSPWLFEYGDELTVHPEQLLDEQPDHWQFPLDRMEWTEGEGVVSPDAYPSLLELMQMGTLLPWKHELLYEKWEDEYEVVRYESGEVLFQHEDAGNNPNFEGDPVYRQPSPDAEAKQVSPSEMERSKTESESASQEQHLGASRSDPATGDEDTVTLDDLIN